ncbi:peptidyl-prolyl cis-trans isomerase [Noviluteimonas dokdonensis]|nr:peptidylprolyl isomerase [Lysobacter dokdonensis]
MHRVMREPLLQFLAIGAMLFALDAWVGRGTSPESPAIVVDQAHANALAAQFQRTWQRPPTPSELREAVDAWVDDELLYREGVSAGLDRDDEVVRRRVAQRLVLFNEGMAASVPDEAELQAWLRTHPTAYRIAPRYTLRQVYFDPARRGARLNDDLVAARTQLARDGDASPGDATLLPAHLDDMAADDVAGVFGGAFANAVDRVPLGRWSGPVTSGFGVHLVRVDARTPARMPALAEVRDAVERDWLHDRMQRANRAFLAMLRKRYTVDIEADLARAIRDDGRRLASDGAP